MKLQRIVDEVLEELSELCLIAKYSGKLFKCQLPLRFFKPMLEISLNLSQNSTEIYRFEGLDTGTHTRKLEQVINQGSHSPSCVRDELCILSSLRIVLNFPQAPDQQLRETGDCSQRLLQIMTGHIGELFELPITVLQRQTSLLQELGLLGTLQSKTETANYCFQHHFVDRRPGLSDIQANGKNPAGMSTDAQWQGRCGLKLGGLPGNGILPGIVRLLIEGYPGVPGLKQVGGLLEGKAPVQDRLEIGISNLTCLCLHAPEVEVWLVVESEGLRREQCQRELLGPPNQGVRVKIQRQLPGERGKPFQNTRACFELCPLLTERFGLLCQGEAAVLQLILKAMRLSLPPRFSCALGTEITEIAHHPLAVALGILHQGDFQRNALPRTGEHLFLVMTGRALIEGPLKRSSVYGVIFRWGEGGPVQFAAFVGFAGKPQEVEVGIVRFGEAPVEKTGGNANRTFIDETAITRLALPKLEQQLGPRNRVSAMECQFVQITELCWRERCSALVWSEDQESQETFIGPEGQKDPIFLPPTLEHNRATKCLSLKHKSLAKMSELFRG
ncbi:hypothetical protein ASF71_20830 [Deinococcus sp. Leaf326]|nr:hypothetical protein ASF71_20830 [Deinococcus sp. Leaf326]